MDIFSVAGANVSGLSHTWAGMPTYSLTASSTGKSCILSSTCTIYDTSHTRPGQLGCSSPCSTLNYSVCASQAGTSDTFTGTAPLPFALPLIASNYTPTTTTLSTPPHLYVPHVISPAAVVPVNNIALVYLSVSTNLLISATPNPSRLPEALTWVGCAQLVIPLAQKHGLQYPPTQGWSSAHPSWSQWFTPLLCLPPLLRC